MAAEAVSHLVMAVPLQAAEAVPKPLAAAVREPTKVVALSLSKLMFNLLNSK